MLSLGKRIQYFRKQNHLTQEQLAEKLTVSRQAISKWESDVNEPDIKTLIILSEIFDITLDELVKGRIDEDKIVEDVNEGNETRINEIDHEILKTNKKNHRLLMFLTGFVICLICIFIICPLVSSINYYEPTVEDQRVTNISKQLEDNRYLVSYLSLEAEITDYTKQLMLFKGDINFSYGVLENESIENININIIYKDGSQEELGIFANPNGSSTYQFNKEILAKDIDKIVVEAGEMKREFDHVAFPIEKYMYALVLEPEYVDVTKNSYGIRFQVNSLSISENMFNEFENCVSISGEDHYDLSAISEIKIVMKKDDKILKTMNYDRIEELSHIITVDESYQMNSHYEFELSYLTPLKQEMKYIFTNGND